ncbi:hypothetical protein GCM10007908_04150 [Rhizobium albus]|nr:hypothetical protein GCM10007908_04150 [Rhizobium albus]
MSSQNDENKGMIMVLAFVGAMLYALALVAFVVFIIASLVLTVLCLLAWNKPRRLGKEILMPDEARGFVKRGLLGAFLLPLCCFVLELFTDFRLNPDYLFYVVLFGYALGSLGMAILMANQAGSELTEQTDFPPVQPLAPPPPQERPQIPFRFASWDDEKGR